jgi:hypothetical protein
MSIKKREVVSHPGLVKLISVVTALFLIGTFAVNAYVMASGYLLNWGFYWDSGSGKSKTDPRVVFTTDGSNYSIVIPIYVYNNNTMLPGFAVNGLSANFSIYNSSGLVISSVNGPWDIPYPGGIQRNLTLSGNNPGIATTIDNGPIDLQILFHVSYALTSTTLNVTMTFPTGVL